MQATQRTHAVVLHYIRLLTGMAVADLIQVLPGLPKLIGTCQIGPECAMALYRPVLRNLYKLSGSDPAAEKLLQGVVCGLQRFFAVPGSCALGFHACLTLHCSCTMSFGMHQLPRCAIAVFFCVP